MTGRWDFFFIIKLYLLYRKPALLNSIFEVLKTNYFSKYSSNFRFHKMKFISNFFTFRDIKILDYQISFMVKWGMYHFMLLIKRGEGTGPMKPRQPQKDRRCQLRQIYPLGEF